MGVGRAKVLHVSETYIVTLLVFHWQVEMVQHDMFTANSQYATHERFRVP